MKYVYFLLWILLSTQLSFATIYYFSPSGNDVNTGTSMSSPWKTIAKLNLVDLNPGDQVMFQGGAIFNGSIYFESTDKGTAAQPVILTSYGTGRAIINGGTLSGLYAENTVGIEIRGINFIAGSGNRAPGIFFYMDRTDIYMDHITIEDVEVSGFKSYGITIGASEAAGTKGFSDVLINRVLSHDNEDGGISSYGGDGAIFNHNNIRVTNCKAYNNKGLTGATGNTGNGIVLMSAENSLIDNCEAYNNGENNTFTGGGPVGIWFSQVRNSIIQNSISHDNKTQTIDGGGFDLDNGCTNCIIQYCYSYNNMGAGYLLANYGTAVSFEGNIVRYNISQNDGLSAGSGSIHIWGPTAGAGAIKNCEIYNNTIYTGRTGLLLADVNFTNVKIKNNILYSQAGANLLSGSATIDSTKVHLVQNLYYSPATPIFRWNNVSYSSLAAWKAAALTQERMGSTQYGIYADPLFNLPGQAPEGYKLNDNSPAINTGLHLTNIGTRDFYGGANKIGNFQDIGADEKQGATNNSNGLSYSYYEGSWNSLPDFNMLTPVKTGTTPNIDLGVRTAGRNDNFAVVWQGYINIATPGNYTFETISDDGSRLYFNSSYAPTATALVNNDGLHAPASASGTINIPSAGSYPITITFFEKDGGETMQLFWTGPGITRQLIPNAAFTGTPPTSSSGLNYRYYEGSWNSLPDFNTLTPVKTGTTPNIDLGVRTAGRNDNFAFVWQGYINIATPGNYTFETISDDGSRLYFNSSYAPTATALVNNDGLHAPASASGTINIPSAGSYPITITFFEKDGGETMQLFWTGPGITRQLIPSAAFTNNTGSSSAGFNATGTGIDQKVKKEDAEIIKAFPNPFTEKLHVQFYNSASGNQVNISVSDLSGRLLHNYHPGQLATGYTTFSMNLSGKQKLLPGIYLVKIYINGILSKTLKLIKEN